MQLAARLEIAGPVICAAPAEPSVPVGDIGVVTPSSCRVLRVGCLVLAPGEAGEGVGTGVPGVAWVDAVQAEQEEQEEEKEEETSAAPAPGSAAASETKESELKSLSASGG